MDTSIERRLDEILEHEVAKGYRLKDVPLDVRAELRGYGLPDIPRVRFSRLNPSKRRTASEIVQRQYQRDLQTKDILSNAQVLKLVTERGEWGDDKEVRVKTVTDTVNRLMTELYADGVAAGVDQWGAEILEKTSAVRLVLDRVDGLDEDREAMQAVFNRWLEFTKEKQDEFTAKYAAEQNRAKYSHDRDLGRLMDALAQIDVESMNLLLALQSAMEKVHRFVEMTELRAEQSELQVTKARIFADTVESRRDHNEELARLFVTCEQVGIESERPLGPVVPTFESIFELPDRTIRWLLEESYFFHSAIPDSAREYLATFGFLRAEETSATASAPSAVSPAQESSNPDSPPAVATAANSSAPVGATT